MKRIIWILAFFVLPKVVSAQTPAINRQYTFTSASAGTILDITSNGLGYVKTMWDVRDGTLSACTFNLQGSIDGVNFVDIYAAVQTCTTDGQIPVVPIGVNSSFLRINVATFTRSGGANARVTFNIQGWTEVNPNPGAQILLQPLQLSGITANTNTRGGAIGMQQYMGCTILINITTGGTATGTMTLYIQDSVDNGTTWDDMIASNTFALGASATTQRFFVSGNITPAIITTATAVNITQGSVVSTDALTPPAARQGPWGDRWRIREKIASPSGSPVGAQYTINAVCKR